MEKKEFNLSDKIHKETNHVVNTEKIHNLQRIEIWEEEHLPINAVKEFIKRLNDEINLKLKEGLGTERYNFFINGEDLKEFINKLAGKELI